jgi:hypothetical protein
MVQPMKLALSSLKHLPFGGAGAVQDPDMFQAIDSILINAPASSMLKDVNIQYKFLEQYQEWIHGSKHNTLKGLTGFGVACYSNGTTESFDKFYLQNQSRRFRCFRGEYMYHMASWRNYFPNWKYIDNNDIDDNDALVISAPFSDTGNIHPETEAVLKLCDKLGVPVLIDLAFFGACYNINLDLDHECITDLTFSLSKSFPMSHARVGMRLTREDTDDSLLVHHKTNYTNRIGAGLGMALMSMFDADYQYHKWGDTQKRFCNKLGIQTSNTVLFGVDHGKYPEYNRGATSNRINLSPYFVSGKLPTV